MKVFACDRCHFVEPPAPDGGLPKGWDKIKRRGETFQICPTCVEQLEAWWMAGKPEQGGRKT